MFSVGSYDPAILGQEAPFYRVSRHMGCLLRKVGCTEWDTQGVTLGAFCLPACLGFTLQAAHILNINWKGCLIFLVQNQKQ